MKVLFIHTDIHRYEPKDYGHNGFITWHDMQFGISYISSYLKKFNHITSLLFINRYLWEEDILRCIEDYKPDMICFGGVSTQFKHVLKIAQFAKQRFPKIYQIYGGVHATLSELELTNLPFDSICKGEGEIPLSELIDKFENGGDVQKIKNLIIKEDGKIFSNPTRPLLHGLDQLPFPDREMWKRYINSSEINKHVLLLSRGCPFDCTYCSNKALQQISQGQYVRFRSPENIIDELKFIRREYPDVADIFFETESIIINLSWLKKFCERLYEFNASIENPLIFGTNIRIVPGVDYGYIFEILKRAGFKYVAIGIESGSEKVRRDILHRNYSNSDIINVFKKAKVHGLRVHAYNMIGVPGETPQDFKKTIEINRICQPEDPHLCIFFPYPGTDLFKSCIEKGILRKDIDFIDEREDASIETASFPSKKVEKYYARFEWDIYRGKRSTIALLRRYIYRRFIIKNIALLKTYVFLRKIQKVFFTKTKYRNIRDNDIPETIYPLW